MKRVSENAAALEILDGEVTINWNNFHKYYYRKNTLPRIMSHVSIFFSLDVAVIVATTVSSRGRKDWQL